MTYGFILNARKVSGYFVRAMVHPLEKKVELFNFNKNRCQVCLQTLRKNNETNTFTKQPDTVAKQTYKINRKLNCDEKC